MAAQSRPILCLPFQASGAVAFGRAVGAVAPASSSTLAAAQATVSGQKVVAVANRAAANGEMFEGISLGTAICETGAAIAVNARVQCDAQGRVITAVAAGIAAGAVAVTSAAANGTTDLTGADLPGYSWGIALASSAGAGEFIEVLITG